MWPAGDVEHGEIMAFRTIAGLVSLTAMSWANVALAEDITANTADAVAAAEEAAADAADDQQRRTQDGEEIVVTAVSLEESLPQELSRYGYKVEVIEEETIRNRGYIDIAQALDMEVPGLTVMSQAGPFSYANISLQGSRNSDVLWTIDGVRIGNRLYNSTSPADTLPAAMVQQVEVLKGGHGLFYGTQALAGVINLVTHRFDDETSGDFTVGSSTNVGYRAEGRVNLALGDHRLMVWGVKDQGEGFAIFDKYNDTVTDRERSYDVLSAGIKYGYDFTPDLSVMLHYMRTWADLDNQSVSAQNINMRDQQIAIARIDYTPSESAKLYLKSYYHQWDTDYGPAGGATEYWGFKDFGFNALAQLKLHPGLEYHIGYEYQTYKGRDDVLLIDGQSEQVHAFFGQIRTSDDFSDRLRLAAGLRHNEQSDSSSTVWNASGSFVLSPALQLDASVGTSFLLPDAQQLYGIDDCCAHGNPNLKPEESFAINLGASGRIGGFRWSLAGWDRKIENLIASSTIGAPEGFNSIFVNVPGQVKARGFEALVAAQLPAGFDAMVTYTYSEEIARNTNIQIQGRPKHSGKAALNWSPEDAPYGASLTAKYFGKTENTLTGLGLREWGDFIVADLSAHSFLDDDQRWRASVRLENVFDQDAARGLSSALINGERSLVRRLGAPRTFYLTISHSFGAR